MWDTIRAKPIKYLFSSAKYGRWGSDNQNTLAPVYPEVLSLRKTSSTALSIPTRKPVFTHSELLESIKEGISGSNLPPDPAGRNKENHPLYRAEFSPRVPTLFYLSEDSRLDDATTRDSVLSQLAIRLSDSYNDYISNCRSEYEVGYPDEVVTPKQSRSFEVVQSCEARTPPRQDPSLLTVWEAKANIPAQSQTISCLIGPRDTSGSYGLRRGMGSSNPRSGLRQRALYLNEKAQIRRLMDKNEWLSMISGTKTPPRHHGRQASIFGLPDSRFQVTANQQAPSSPSIPVQALQENPDQAPHIQQAQVFAPSIRVESPVTMAQILALKREMVIAMCGFPNPPLTSSSPPHPNTPPPSTKPPLPSPPTPGPARVPQTSNTPPTFKIPRKPLPPSALQNLSRSISALEAIQPPTKEDFKSSEQSMTKLEPTLTPLPRSKSTLSMSSIRSSISGSMLMGS
ncbi:unnamed protein product [Tuber aestivum]|uniref:Uncharacterized protein n=1 Tax=Tuber aestivum TaxID=59557 RepID=A0A292PTP9_9PEZI|nr:unnamed protein product [Tuber aestivum]